MPLRDEQGLVVGIFCVVEEATERVMAQAALREREARQMFRVELSDALRGASSPQALTAIAGERLGQNLDVSCVGYAVVDPTGEYVLIDQDWTATGTPSVVGTHRLDDFGPGMANELKAGRVVRVDDTATSPLTAGPRSEAAYDSIGTRAFINVPLAKNGRLAGVWFVHNPRTRVWTDDETAIVEEVAERTWASLQRLHAEEALRQSQKMEAVGQLTGGLAHDFNNLLVAISGSLELLQTRVAQQRFGELERYIAAALAAAKRAASLTHRLLAFSRRQTPDSRPTSVNRLVASMAELIQRTVGPEIAVEVTTAGGLWNTLVDPNQLEDALLNLCINARDAMPDGGRLTVGAANKWLDEHAGHERELPSEEYLVLKVTDTGAGMTPDVVRRAYNPLFTTKPIGMGTGLGLSMIYGFVQQSGGQAHIVSEPGQGATICLYLPRHCGEVEAVDTPVRLAVAPRAEQDETVLVIDDEPPCVCW